MDHYHGWDWLSDWRKVFHDIRYKDFHISASSQLIIFVVVVSCCLISCIGSLIRYLLSRYRSSAIRSSTASRSVVDRHLVNHQRYHLQPVANMQIYRSFSSHRDKMRRKKDNGEHRDNHHNNIRHHGNSVNEDSSNIPLIYCHPSAPISLTETTNTSDDINNNGIVQTYCTTVDRSARIEAHAYIEIPANCEFKDQEVINNQNRSNTEINIICL